MHGMELEVLLVWRWVFSFLTSVPYLQCHNFGLLPSLGVNM